MRTSSVLLCYVVVSQSNGSLQSRSRAPMRFCITEAATSARAPTPRQRARAASRCAAARPLTLALPPAAGDATTKVMAPEASFTTSPAVGAGSQLRFLAWADSGQAVAGRGPGWRARVLARAEGPAHLKRGPLYLSWSAAGVTRGALARRPSLLPSLTVPGGWHAAAWMPLCARGT
jgi:hypothetical protein